MSSEGDRERRRVKTLNVRTARYEEPGVTSGTRDRDLPGVVTPRQRRLAERLEDDDYDTYTEAIEGAGLSPATARSSAKRTREAEGVQRARREIRAERRSAGDKARALLDLSMEKLRSYAEGVSDPKVLIALAQVCSTVIEKAPGAEIVGGPATPGEIEWLVNRERRHAAHAWMLGAKFAAVHGVEAAAARYGAMLARGSPRLGLRRRRAPTAVVEAEIVAEVIE